jgi:hypothetical protein
MNARPLFPLILLIAASAGAAPVRVVTGAGGSTLEVDGKPFLVKGVGCNTAEGADGEDYLGMARDMGANAVRTWGVMPRDYFDKAQADGLLVDAGIWFNPIRGTMKESYRDTEHRRKLKADALAYVHELKDHPAILSWNLGNEVFAFTDSDREKEAFGKFLEDLAKAVKKEDPNHPIIYACAGGRDIEWIHRLVPSVDIVGINTYGGYRGAAQKLAALGDKRPVIATEFGPRGAWDMKKDVSGLPFEPDDHSKAIQYADLWREVSDSSSSATLGGFAFVLGESRNQDSLTWWNLNYGALKREGYWAMYTAFTGQEPANRPPRIRVLKVSRVTDLAPGEAIDLDVEASDPDGDALEHGGLVTDVATDPLIVQQPRFFPLNPEILSPDKSKVRVHVPNEPGLYRLCVYVRDGKGNMAAATRGLKVIAAAP